MRTIGVVTTSRADYSYYLPLLRAIVADPELELHLMVSGMHLVPEFGLTVKAIEADGFPVAARIESLVASDSPEALGKSVGLGTIGFAQAFSSRRPDILVVLGDRFEMQCAVLAAVPFNIPVAHIGGGEATEGLIDEVIRHAITKMSHLHFVSRTEYARRVMRMGEEPWRVTVTGSLSLDNLGSIESLSDQELERLIGLPLDPSPIVVTYHSLTLAPEKVRENTAAFLAALDELGAPVVFTATNADTQGRQIGDALREYVSRHANARLVPSLGMRGYFSLLRRAVAMAGNSSSGILEAASFELPVVNIGDRQLGRLHAENVVDCADDKQSVLSALKKAVDPAFRESLRGLVNPYGDGKAVPRMIRVLREVPLGASLLIKRFHEGS